MPTVLLLPDTALLVPGAAGQVDPLAGARAAAESVLRSVPRGARTLVIAPGREPRVLSGPFGDGLAAAGLASGAGRTGRGRAPGVGAAAALALLVRTGHDPDRTATVLEVAPSSPALGAPEAPSAPFDTPAEPDLVVVVGSLSARHGPDAPLPDDPAAIAADVALLTALAAGPRALAEVFGDLDLPECDRLAITGGRPWRAVLSLLAGDGPLPEAGSALLWSGTPGGAQHAVARWDVRP